MQALGGADAMVLAGRVLMQLGSQEKAVLDAVKEVIRILKKTRPAQVPQVCSLLQAPAPRLSFPPLYTSPGTVVALCCMMLRTQLRWNGAWLVKM